MGVETTEIAAASYVTDLLGNKDGNTVRIPAEKLAAQLSLDAVAVNKATRAQLYADLDWAAGARGAVWGDETEALRGIYVKTGAVGAGSWSRIGDLPMTALSSTQLAAKADQSALDAAVQELRQRAGSFAIRPGEAPDAWAIFPASGAGAPEAGTAIVPGTTAGVTVSQRLERGRVLTIADRDITVGPRATWPVQPEMVYRIDVWDARERNPADPEGDAVRIRLACLDADYGVVQTITLTAARLDTGPVRHLTATFAISTALGTPDRYLDPATVQIRPIIRTYGADHETDLIQVQIRDITEAAQIAGGLDVLALAAARDGAVSAASAAANDRAVAVSAQAAAQAAADEARLYDGPKVDVFGQLAGITPTMLAVGSYVRVIKTGCVYQRVSSGGDLDYSGSGGVRLRVVVDGISEIDAAAFGVFADGVTSDSMALQRAINALQGTGCTLLLPAGTLIYNAELQITNAITIRGTGRRTTIFQPAPGYAGWFLSLTEANFIGTSNQGPIPDRGNDTAGVSLTGFSVRSRRGLGTGAQHGIRCVGRNDRLKFSEIYIECLEGTHFHFGHMNGASSTPAFIRECEFYDCESRGGGNAATGSPAVVIDSYGSGDASNLCNFFGFRVVYPYERGLRIINNSSANAIRRMNFFGLLLHGLGTLDPSVTSDLMRIEGDVRWSDFHSIMSNSTNVGQVAVRTVAAAGVAPRGLTFGINVSSGSGDTFNFEAGSTIFARVSALGSTGTALTVGAGVSGPIVFDAIGQTFTKSIDASAAGHVSCAVTYDDAVPFRAGRVVFGNTSSASAVLSGAGSPVGVVSAPSGSLYLNRTGSSTRDSDSAYLKRGGVDASGWDPIQVCVGGSTAQRPTAPTQYQVFWDATINKLCTWDGTNWRDALGAIV